ncbi:MAG: ImmA/IrrE family metallo-endopeptidase [Croceivirga sp.]
MNTVQIGDNFESRCNRLIAHVIENHELSLEASHCKVIEKPKYYSVKRKKKITFDLSIEVTPPKAEKPFLVCIIECKSLNKPVPVDDVEEFESKVGGIQDFQTKKIMIAQNGFQSGAFEMAKNMGITLIHVDEDDYNIVLYKPNKHSSRNSTKSLEKELEKLIKKSLLPKRIKGLKKLSANDINQIAVDFLNRIDDNITKRYWNTPLEKVSQFLENEHGLKIKSEYNIVDANGASQLGYYDVKNGTIFINQEIIDSIRYPFVFSHEVGHFLLHSKLKTHQFTYDNFKDSDYSLFTQTHLLENDKHWVEWQANCFAASLLMPKNTLIARLISVQTNMGISKQGKIYLDNQEINRKDHRKIVKALSAFFGVSQTTVEYRLESLGLIEHPPLSKKEEKDKEFLRQLSKLRNF